MRGDFESRFDRRFDGVRIHEGAGDAAAARSIGALAFTVGSDIYFDRGRYAPGTPDGRRLLAHELSHVVQQGERPDGTLHRFGSREHEAIGDSADQIIDLGAGVRLTWGQVVALAGDYYGSLDPEVADPGTRPLAAAMSDLGSPLQALREDLATDAGRARLRETLLEFSKDMDVSSLPVAPGTRAPSATAAYVGLAIENLPHFVRGGGALSEWHRYHSEAIRLAVIAGLANDRNAINDAYLAEAFGNHFLTDSFSGGHVRTPRAEIHRWYTEHFAPRVFDHFVTQLVNRVGEAVDAQAPLYVPEFMVIERVRAQVEAAIARAGGRARMVTILGEVVGGMVSGALHDREGAKGVMVSSVEHPNPWRAPGDGGLAVDQPSQRTPDAEISLREAQRAVLAAKWDVDAAFDLGVHESVVRRQLPQPSQLPERAYFAFDSAVLKPNTSQAILQVVAYMTYHPATMLELIGNADPIGETPYNDDLGQRRAEAIRRDLVLRGVDESRIRVSSQGERMLVARRPGAYWRNRRVDFVWSTDAMIAGQATDVAFERAMEQARRQLGPPYAAEGFLPVPVSGANEALPDWRWGHMSADFLNDVAGWVPHQLGPFRAQILEAARQNPIRIREPITLDVNTEVIARGLLDELLRDPIGMLTRLFGESASAARVSPSDAGASPPGGVPIPDLDSTDAGAPVP